MLFVANRKLSKRQLAAIHAKSSHKIGISNKIASNIQPTGISKYKFKIINPQKNPMLLKEKIQQHKTPKSLLEKITPNKIELSIKPIPAVNLTATWELKPDNT